MFLPTASLPSLCSLLFLLHPASNGWPLLSSFPHVAPSSPGALNVISTLLTLTGKLSDQNSPLTLEGEYPTFELMPPLDWELHMSSIELLTFPPDLVSYQEVASAFIPLLNLSLGGILDCSLFLLLSIWPIIRSCWLTSKMNSTSNIPSSLAPSEPRLYALRTRLLANLLGSLFSF